jgi:hypothetical protein
MYVYACRSDGGQAVGKGSGAVRKDSCKGSSKDSNKDCVRKPWSSEEEEKFLKALAKLGPKETEVFVCVCVRVCVCVYL